MVIFNSFLYVYQRVIRCYSAGATHSEVRTKISGTNLGTWELGGAVGGCDGFTAMETSAGIYPQDPISSIYQYIIYIYQCVYSCICIPINSYHGCFTKTSWAHDFSTEKKIRFQSPMTTWKDPGNLLLPSGNLLWLQKSSFMCVWLCMYNIWVCYSIDLYRYMLYSGKFLGKHPQIRDFCQLKLPEFPPVHRALSPHLPSGVLRKTSRAAEGRRRDGQNERAK